MVQRSYGSVCANNNFRNKCKNICNKWKQQKLHWIDSIKSNGYKSQELYALYDSIPPPFKTDRDVMRAALDNGVHLSKLPAMARDDADLMLDMLPDTHQIFDIESMKYISDRLKGDATFMTQLLKKEPRAESIVQCASDNVKNDYTFIELAVRSRINNIIHASPKLLRRRPDIVAYAAVRAAQLHEYFYRGRAKLGEHDPVIRIVLKYLSDNYQIMSFLVKQNDDLIHYASDEVKRHIKATENSGM